MKKITPQRALVALLFSLVLVLFSPWVKFSFSQNPQKEVKSQTFSLLSGRRNNLQNITGTIVQMPNKNYVTSYLSSLENSPEISIQTYELTEKRVKSWIKQKAESWTQFRIMLENNKYQQFQNTFKKLQNERSWLQNIKLISDEHLPTTYLHSKVVFGFRVVILLILLLQTIVSISFGVKILKSFQVSKHFLTRTFREIHYWLVTYIQT